MLGSSNEATKAWDLYWKSGTLESCVTQSDLLVSQTLGHFWGQFALRLPKEATVIDLATGNGSVVKQLLSSVNTLKITAVDIAKIQPQVNDSHLAAASFVPNIDITDLPYADGSFAGVCSQFGAEYAMSSASKQKTMAEEAARVLASKGQLQFLMHNTQSSLLLSNKAKLIEFECLFSADGLVASLQKYAQGAATLFDMERAGEAYLALDIIKTKHISGQVFDAITYFLQQPLSDELTHQIADVLERVKAEKSRLQQLQNAALSETEMHDLATNFENLGVIIQVREALLVPNESGNMDILGWQIQGCKQ